LEGSLVAWLMAPLPRLFYGLLLRSVGLDIGLVGFAVGFHIGFEVGFFGSTVGLIVLTIDLTDFTEGFLSLP